MNKLQKHILQAAGLLTGVLVIAAAGHHIALQAEEKRLVPPGQLVEVDGRNIHVYCEGDRAQGPALVFLSGSGTVAPVYDFRPLYRLLSPHFPIAVVEKTGYGYSDISDVPRDVASMVDEVRRALDGADVPAPYVLLPHSMSGLEAIYWAQTYPDEVAGIIGLDMAVPHSYDEFDLGGARLSLAVGGLARTFGIHRIPGVYPLSDLGLTAQEQEQLALLMHRNAVNPVYAQEGNAILDNVQTVQAQPVPRCPILLFCSTGGQQFSPAWEETQREFADQTGGELQILDCGHYLHYEKSPELAEAIGLFLQAKLLYERT